MILTYKVNRSPWLVFDYLTNMSKFVSVHPVINNMLYLEENKYRVFETLKLGLFQFSFTYPAAIDIYYENKRVVMTATLRNSNTIEMVFDIKEIEGAAIVQESINFKTRLPVKAMLCWLFKRQHAKLFKNIENSI